MEKNTTKSIASSNNNNNYKAKNFVSKKNKRISQEKIKHNYSLVDSTANNNANSYNDNQKNIRKICGKTKAGKYSDGKDKTNQDSYLIKNKIFGIENFSLVGVFDGHGGQGHFISSLLKLFFSEYYTKKDLYSDNKQIINNINSTMKNCFSDLNNISNFTNNYTGNFYNYSNFNNYNNFNHSLSLNLNSSNNVNNNYLNSTLFNSGALTTRKNSSNINFKDFLNKDKNNNDGSNSIYYEKLAEENFSIIKNSFILAESAFAQSKFDMNFSGSTCVCVFVIDDRIICANCGDSRAILVTHVVYKNENRYAPPTSTSLSKFNIVPLSIDHKPDLKEEAYRIVKNSGRIEKRNENGIKTGPLRVWLKNENYPGLAMTRSIGDMVASKIGVVSEPEIKEYKVDKNCKYVVVASDGIWEIFSNEEVALIINPFYETMDVNGATEKLVEEASLKWRRVIKCFI